MHVSKMYKIESIITLYKMFGIVDVRELDDLMYNHNLTYGYSEYYKCTILIPYKEMLIDISYYNNSDMDEVDEIFWWEKLCKKYEIETYRPTLDEVIWRFKCVNKLSKSLIYSKKMEELYNYVDNLKSNNGIKLVKK